MNWNHLSEVGEADLRLQELPGYWKWKLYGVFSHDVTVAILVSQNNETAAMLESQAVPVGIELFSHANAFFCSNKFA